MSRLIARERANAVQGKARERERERERERGRLMNLDGRDESLVTL